MGSSPPPERFQVAAAAAGDDVIEPHTETRDGRGHEELHVVVRGAARFELDGEAFAAPAGTLVFVAADVHRHAVAVETGTEVLAFGGDPVFRPSGACPRAAARRVRARPGARGPAWPTFPTARACCTPASGWSARSRSSRACATRRADGLL